MVRAPGPGYGIAHVGVQLSHVRLHDHMDWYVHRAELERIQNYETGTCA